MVMRSFVKPKRIKQMNKLSDEKILEISQRPFDAEMGEVITMALELKERRALALLAEAATKEKSATQQDFRHDGDTDFGERERYLVSQSPRFTSPEKWECPICGAGAEECCECNLTRMEMSVERINQLTRALSA